MSSYTNRAYCNSDITLTLSRNANDTDNKYTNLNYSLTLILEGGENSAHSKVNFSLSKPETVELLKSLIDLQQSQLDKFKRKEKNISLTVFSKVRLGIKYVVEFVPSSYGKDEEVEEEHEFIGWDFQIAVYTDKMIGDCSVKLGFRFSEYGSSAHAGLKRMKEFACRALNDIEKEETGVQV